MQFKGECSIHQNATEKSDEAGKEPTGFSNMEINGDLGENCWQRKPERVERGQNRLESRAQGADSEKSDYYGKEIGWWQKRKVIDDSLKQLQISSSKTINSVNINFIVIILIILEFID